MSPFGSFSYSGSALFNHDNLQRLYQLDTIEHLHVDTFSIRDNRALLPLAAKVDCLECYLSLSPSLTKADFQSLNIVTRKLHLVIRLDPDFPTEAIVSLWRRIAELGHFVELRVRFCWQGHDMHVPFSVIEEIIRAATANFSLTLLDLSDHGYPIYWERHVQRLLEGLKDHKRLRSLKISSYNYGFGPEYCYLRQFLSHNRNITVFNGKNDIHSNGSLIDDIYSLNRFFRGSADLVVRSSSERTFLVVTALVESASRDLQRSALLLSNHVDALCELVQWAKLDERSEDESSTKLKRRARIQPCRAAKKASRSGLENM